MACALGDEILSVVPEYFEDLAIQRRDGWYFCQVKTRRQDLRPWRLANLLEDGGALHSLVRTYRALRGRLDSFRLAIILEGSVNSTDAINGLRSPLCPRNETVKKAMARKFDLTDPEFDDFLGRVVLCDNLPRQQEIVASNLRLLGKHSPSLSFADQEFIHNQVCGLLFEAMQGERLTDQWPTALLIDAGAIVGAPSPRTSAAMAKRLDKSKLAPMFAKVTQPPRSLLRRIVDVETHYPTVLEQKLLAGGADADLVRRAAQLRANATSHATAVGTLSDSGKLEDLESRLEILASAVVAKHASVEAPAKAAWSELVADVLPAQAANLDHQSLFTQDPFLLLGYICEMSDQCRLAWGTANA